MENEKIAALLAPLLCSFPYWGIILIYSEFSGGFASSLLTEDLTWTPQDTCSLVKILHCQIRSRRPNIVKIPKIFGGSPEKAEDFLKNE